MSWLSIPHAHEYWKTLRRLANPPADLEDAETFILSGRPRTAQDAACILDVVRAYYGDARCDGLDREALERVHALLSVID